MTINKCTLIVDGNWLLMSRLWAVKDYFKEDQGPEENQRASQELKELMAKSISITLQKFYGYVDNIIIIGDRSSWRKELDKPKTLAGFNYKGNRTPADGINWDLIWDTATNFFDNCRKLGMTVTRIEGMEGDDLAYYWSRRLNAKGINCIIWSTDQDLLQLAQYRDCIFTAWYNNEKGIGFSDKAQETPVDSIDFFMQPMPCINPLLNTLTKAFKTFYVNPDMIVMKKVICGDSGDNIQSIIRKKKNGKTFRVSEKNWESLRKDMDIQFLGEFWEKRDAICEELCKDKEYDGVEEVKEEFDYNKKLVWLNGEVIPEELISKGDLEDYSIYEIANIRNNFKVLSGDKDNDEVLKVFEGMDELFKN